MQRPKTITIKKKAYQLPMFLPDATRAVVKSIAPSDISGTGVDGVVVNTYHLMTNPGTSVLKSVGGIKKFMNFGGLVVSDSGGWQVFSLIHRGNKPGKITDKGVTFSIGGGKKKLFSPKKSLEVQFCIDSDIMICLDDFTPPNATEEENEDTVRRTIKWAGESRKVFDELCKKYDAKPLLFAVVQGGYDKKLRKYCADELAKIGFDGYGFGGYLVGVDGSLDLEMVEYIEGVIPGGAIKFCLGVGSPWEIVKCAEMGWDIFDCTLPTRDARHKRLYVFTKDPSDIDNLRDKKTHDYVHIHREKYRRDMSPISEFCDCYTCKNYSKAYLNHLFDIGDSAAWRLATIHNLRTYTILMETIRDNR